MRRFPLPFLALVVCLVTAAPAAAAVNFTTVAPTAVGTHPEGMVSDVFRPLDGRTDLAVANFTSSNLSVLLGNGNGTFANASGSPFGGVSNPLDVGAADFNNDGFEDVIAGGSSEIRVYFGNGNGGFSPAGGTLVSNSVPNVSSIAVAFFDENSNNLDFAVSTHGAGAQTVRVFLGNGNGTFALQPTSYPAGSGETHLLSEVFDDATEPNADLAVTSDVDHTVRPLVNNGDGSFTAAPVIDLGAGSSPLGLGAGDLNNDGKEDLAVALNGSSAVATLLRTGNGTFGSPTNVPMGSTPEDVAVADYDNDGNLDLAATNFSPATVTYKFGTGTGTGFNTGGTLNTQSGPTTILSDDFDKDANADLAVANSGSGSVSMFLVQAPSASVNPTSLAFGNQVVNTQSATRTVTLTNNGPQTIGPLATITGPNRDDFVRINDRCTPASIFVPPGGTCTIGVAAKPRSTGDKTATLEINSNAANSPQRVALSTTGVPPAPVSQTAPAISGTAVRGDTLTCSNGTWSNSPTSFAHQWLRNGQAIPGATAANYTVVEADVGTQLACHVTASNAGGSNSRTSASVTPTAPTPVVTVTVPRQTLNTVLSKGLAFRTTCANPCLISAQLTGPVPPKKKKRKSTRGRAARTAVVGRTSASLVGGTLRTLRIRVNRAGKLGLRGKRSATFKLAVTATDPSGSPRTTKTVRVTVKRSTKRKARAGR